MKKLSIFLVILGFSIVLPTNNASADIWASGVSESSGWFDADSDKDTLDDEYMVWAASAANILMWSGWNAGYANEDQIFDFFVEEDPVDSGGWFSWAWKFWFDGGILCDPHFVGSSHTGYYSTEEYDAVYAAYYDPPDAMTISKSLLLDHYGVAWHVQPITGITLWGIKTDETTGDYLGVWVTDSYNQYGSDPRPDELTYLEVEWRDGEWYLINPLYPDWEIGYVGNIAALKMKLVSNTPKGSDISVLLVPETTGELPVEVTFDEVTEAGMTTLSASSAGEAPPSGFVLTGVYYEITTTAGYLGEIHLEIQYDDTGLGNKQEKALRLYHYEDGFWVDVTDLPVDTVNNIIRGTVDSFSEFAVFVPEDTTPPVMDCPDDITVEAATMDGTTVSFPLPVATDEVDPDPVVVADPPSGTMFPLGDTTVTVTATDNSGNSSTCVFTVTVQDTTPPTIQLFGPDPPVLWPANHKFVEVVIMGTAADICDDGLDAEDIAVSVEVLDAEGGDGGSNHDLDYEMIGASIDADGIVEILVSLRAERSSQGDGRVYRITASVTDDLGNTGTSNAVEVTVPHDQGNGKKK